MGRGLKKNNNILSFGIILSVIAILFLIVIAGCSNTLMDDVLEKIEVDKNNEDGIKILSGPQSPSPSDGLSISDVTPQLNWEDISGAAAYHVQISEFVDFSGIMSIDDNTPTVSQYDVDITESLDNGKTYYWRIQVQNTDNIWGGWSIVWQFTIDITPDIPANPNPSSGSSIMDTTPLLVWGDITSALTYHIQINTADDFSGIIIDDIGDLALSQYQIPTEKILSDNTTYYWRVRINIEDDIQSEWSDTWSFSIDIPPPTILSPFDTDTLIDTTPNLDWEDVTDALDYHIQVNTNSSFTGMMIVDESVLNASYFQVLSTLSDNTTYYWHIGTSNEDGIQGEWSDTWSFSIDIPYPVSPSPSNGNIISHATPFLDWEDVTDALGYHIEINTNSSFTGTVINNESLLDNSFFQVTSLLSDNTTYYWHVKIKNEDGIWGDWSSSWSFTVYLPVKIVSKQYYSIALRSDGTVWTWGYNHHGQLGDGTIIDQYRPIQVSGFSGVNDIAGGRYHSIALKIGGSVSTWGGNLKGQLGDGTEIDRYTPVQVIGLAGSIIDSAGGRSHTIALQGSNGTVWTWGSNAEGQLGDGTTDDSTTPILIPDFTDVISVASGNDYSIALKSGGTVLTWGLNDVGQLGHGDSSTPVLVPDLTDVTAIAAGDYHTLVLRSDNTVQSWGVNQLGQLGNNSTDNSSIPVDVLFLTNVTAIAAGQYHSIALKDDGTVWVWGYNNYGQLGNNSTSRSLFPIIVDGLTDIIAIAGGEFYTMALQNDGTIWTWGYNAYGQLGDGTTITRGLPGPVFIE